MNLKKSTFVDVLIKRSVLRSERIYVTIDKPSEFQEISFEIFEEISFGIRTYQYTNFLSFKRTVLRSAAY